MTRTRAIGRRSTSPVPPLPEPSTAATDSSLPNPDAPPQEPPISRVPSSPIHASNRFSSFSVLDRPTHEDGSSPYFLSTGDHPALVLASPPLTDKNFQQWRRDFKISIRAKNKLPFLNGSLPQPAEDDPLLNQWLRCNHMVMSWILHSISSDIKSSILFLDSVAAMWNELNSRFDQGNGPKIFDLRTSLISLHQGDDSVSSYFTKIKAIWDEITDLCPRLPCTCAASADTLDFLNQEHVLQFLTGLNESFHAVRAQILLIDPFPSLSKVFSMIIQEENQRRLRPSHNTSFIAAIPPSIPPSTSRTKKMRPTCSHCLKPGHLKEKCFFLHGFPPGYGDRRKSDSVKTIKFLSPLLHQVYPSLHHLNWNSASNLLLC
ncbi:uncharacterized protein LOC133815310 [Humulus lupulus]|uniref:uncharacterized protein LOC133815310 n=1 Tax=Humulus lupulus TaxID=3486 RepID=UPI002B405CF6|nr:uncharacterized protein LOC133815310 [Humulus lupulus]